jgi:hypothetical protein
MNNRDRVLLLSGPYRPPPLKRGQRASCLRRDADVLISGWTDGRIAWPTCHAVGRRGGGSGILVDDELARAIKHESAAALMHWWRLSAKTVWQWRKTFNIARAGTPGSRRLIQAAAQQGAARNEKSHTKWPSWSLNFSSTQLLAVPRSRCKWSHSYWRHLVSASKGRDQSVAAQKTGSRS